MKVPSVVIIIPKNILVWRQAPEKGKVLHTKN